jgi:hypothetical protein
MRSSHKLLLLDAGLLGLVSYFLLACPAFAYFELGTGSSFMWQVPACFALVLALTSSRPRRLKNQSPKPDSATEI